jgi:hypothetical protein
MSASALRARVLLCIRSIHIVQHTITDPRLGVQSVAYIHPAALSVRCMTATVRLLQRLNRYASWAPSSGALIRIRCKAKM